MDSNPPPPPPHSSYTSFPILAISILGILTTAILLLSYYLFVVKCCLNWRRPHLLLWPRFPSSRSRRHLTPIHPHILHYSLAEPRGLDPSTINSIPTFRFSSSKTTTTSSIECAVCLADFRHQELLRLLPVCSHAFHIDCIDTWLQFNPNCPLCRADTSLFPIQQQHFSTTSNTATNPHPPTEEDSSHVVIDIRDTSGSGSGSGSGSSSTSEQTPTRPTPKSSTKAKKFWQMVSMGDECIDIREKDERFAVQPIRRSFSMDSSNDRQLCVSVQEILRQNPNLFQEVRNGEETSGGGGRIRRSFFSFGRSSRSAASVLPVQSELL